MKTLDKKKIGFALIIILSIIIAIILIIDLAFVLPSFLQEEDALIFGESKYFEVDDFILFLVLAVVLIIIAVIIELLIKKGEKKQTTLELEKKAVDLSEF